MKTTDLPPYARATGIAFTSDLLDGAPVLTLPFSAAVQGRPDYLHGGALAGLMETAGFAALRRSMGEAGELAMLKPINFSTNYLRGAKVGDTFACGRVTRLGRRSANIAVEAWQEDRQRPVAEAVMNVLIRLPDQG
ncbi:MAG: PaaI family thioesterase [Sphingomonadaceae bacterium]|nr:PaaI family thioesterase [Sphingomonadaceae bacterium]